MKKGSPTTLSYPSTHPSFLVRESPLPLGSSMLARIPNPREKALPLHFANPANSLLCPYSSSSRAPNRAFLDTLFSTCLLGQEAGYLLISLRNVRPASANRSMHTRSAFPRIHKNLATTCRRGVHTSVEHSNAGAVLSSSSAMCIDFSSYRRTSTGHHVACVSNLSKTKKSVHPAYAEAAGCLPGQMCATKLRRDETLLTHPKNPVRPKNHLKYRWPSYSCTTFSCFAHRARQNCKYRLCSATSF